MGATRFNQSVIPDFFENIAEIARSFSETWRDLVGTSAGDACTVDDLGWKCSY